MSCSDPRDFLLQYQTLGAFIVIALMLFLSAGQIQSNILRRILYAQFTLIVAVYISLITPWGAQYYVRTYNKLVSSPTTPEKLNPESLNILKNNLTKKWDYHLIYFGYTFCPDVCPTTLNVISQLYKKHETLIHQLPFVFITLDYPRDTPERLTEYVHFFNPQLDYLRLEPTQLSSLTKAFGSRFTINSPDQSGHYSIDHSAEVYLIDSTGKILSTFSHPLKYEEFKQELKHKGVLDE